MKSRPQPWRMKRRLERAGRCLRAPALGYILGRPFRAAQRVAQRYAQRYAQRAARRPTARPTPGGAKQLRADTVRTALYRLWIRRYESASTHPDRGRSVGASEPPDHPLFSILVTGGEDDPAGLRRTRDSVRGQSLGAREVLVANGPSPPPETLLADLGTGTFLLHLAAGDSLAPRALSKLAELFDRRPEIELAYGDEDHLGPDGGRFAPHFKPDWNPDLFWSSGYLGPTVAIRRTLVERAVDLTLADLPAGRLELVARCVAGLPEERIAHLPGILVHRGTFSSRSVSGTREAAPGIDALPAPLVEELLTDRHDRVEVAAGRLPGTLRIVWPLPSSPPRASLIVLTHNGLDLLDRCLDSVRAKTVYPDYEIVLVDHASDDPRTLERLAELTGKDNIQVLRREGPFNFSALNNDAVAATSGDIIVFLNNDVEILTRGWLREMVSLALRPEVGAVGARLLYPDGRLQHGGVLLGGGAPIDAVAGHLSHGIAADDPGYFGRAWTTQAVSAVTAACMVLRREVFERVGRFDAGGLPVAFNDVDLCLRILQTGRRVVWTPWAEAIHHESATRGDDLTGPSRDRFVGEVRLMRDRWGPLLDHDPCYNPNLDPVGCDFALAFPPRDGG